jgi:predicted O-linked N-acetylglucosamine transferase (SPINDLY family)
MKKIERNALCYCGSGKKYKQCCLQCDEVLVATQHAATIVSKSLQDGLAHLLAGRLTEAVVIYQQILQHDPNHPDALLYLGVVEMQRGKTENAIILINKSLSIKPTSAEAHNNLGNALRAQGALSDAIVHFQIAIFIQPKYAAAHNNLGIALLGQGALSEAVAHFHIAISIQPEHVEAHNNLGIALLGQGILSEAIAHFHTAISIQPEYVEAYNNLGIALEKQANLTEAVLSFRRALAIKPDYAEAYSNLLFSLSHTEGMTAQALFAEHLRFGTQFETPLRSQWVAHTQSRDPDRCLKIGFVSGDFFNHAVVSFIEPVLAQLSSNASLSLYAYANSPIDDTTIRLRDYFAHWQKVVGLTDDALAQQIRDDGIDILIDLSGHTAKNRLLTFARKPAPIQASWIGYPGTTGLEAMDYYFADRYLVPLGELEQQFTEKIVCLPAIAPFMPSAYAPPINPLPALANGYVTFGSFNRLNKLNSEIIALWSQLLRAQPDSRMVLGAMPEHGDYENLIAWFAQEGISLERLSFYQRCDMPEYMALHQQVDICLDTFPYTGGTTNHHALWMGIPTLSLLGDTLAGRVGAGILAQVGLDAFIAGDAADFVSKGLFWAGHLTELSEIRTGLRERFKQSAIGQPAVVTAGLAQALRTMWQRWCEGLPTESFEINPEDINKVLQEAKQSCANSLQMAIAHHLAGRLTIAVAIYQQILHHDPAHPDALHYMGMAALQLGMHDNAITLISRSLSIHPNNAEAHSNLANLLRDQGRLDESVAHAHTALSLKQNYPEAHNNLANTLVDQGALSEAIVHLHAAISVIPTSSEVHNNLGIALEKQANLTEAVLSFRRALAIKPDYAEAYSNLLFSLSHTEGMTAQALFAEHLRFGTQFETPLRSQWVAHTQSRDPDRCLKIGFVSGDFFNHAVVSFIEPVLAQLSSNASLSLYAYANSPIDDTTIRLRDYFAHWQKVVGLTDDALAQQIRDDGIDILIDLSGHTAKNRLLTFARKPAPIQASWIGYPGTTGLEAMDYYFADRYLVPLGELEQQFTEKIVCLPAIAPFMPSAYAPPINPLPALANGYVTFGSFNRLNKLNSEIIALWSQLLRAQPDSRMVLGAMPEHGDYENLIAWFAQEGISLERLSFYQRCDMPEYMALHQQVDICLDTFPYTGGTTNHHALWMGIPTLSLLGDTLAGRVGAGILAQVGLDAFIAGDAADFVSKGLFWAGHLTELSEIRTGLRERFKQSAIGQPAVVTAGLAQALRTMWQRWCEGLPTESFEINSQDVSKVLLQKANK